LCTRCIAALRAPPAAPPRGLVDVWVACFAYEGVGRELVARVKYRNNRAALPWLATELAAAVEHEASWPITCLVWPPTTRDRRRSRGFDPAEMLARGVGRRLAIPAVRALARAGGPAQTGLTGPRRREGPRFVARVRLRGTVLVVDDVATTGATL